MIVTVIDKGHLRVMQSIFQPMQGFVSTETNGATLSFRFVEVVSFTPHSKVIV